MAEKEERIYIRGYGENNPCDTCEHTSGEECDYCMENYEWNASITREEAIEKIDYVLQDFGIRKNDLEIAEAALNALLESK